MSDREPKPESTRGMEAVRGDETQLYFSADEVVRVLDDYLAAKKAGNAPSREELLAQHPALATQLEACLAGLDFIHQTQASTQPHQKIGDFRLIREVGRGGMGAVFEAIQISLGRRVALKILRFGPTSDKEAVERFQREAETVATLHHTNIVPIFFVGSENGVNYYAMQFIEGRNLAEVIAESEAEIPPLQVAAWGLQAAEALAHAHRRGVIHRDVKPSNLILDKEDRLWLTDFGLARRLDDVTLSLTGMLLGTPRYMSPEHARASTKRIDHRSDIFSLGATLYELLTRAPAFPGEAAHDVIQRILADEPTPIRQLNPGVPRDLETVVMKCMAKEPGLRYASADDLAADLRAVLDDRPIRARRASRLELARRWLKQNQRSVSQVSTAAMVTLAVTLMTLLAWTGYGSWNMSGVRLGALNPPLVAEILNDRGELVRTETLPMQDVTDLPAGQYQVRVSADGSLSQTFDIALDRRRQDAKYTVNVADQWLVSPQPIEHSYDVFDNGREQAIVMWGKEGVTIHQQHGPPASWSLTISPQTSSVLNAFPGYTNPRHVSDLHQYAFGKTNETRPWVVHEPMDVNGDGIGDIVCAARHQAWLMAISGDGQGVLWFAGRAPELSMTDADRAQTGGNRLTQSSVLYPPLVSDDIDHDGLRDLIVTVANLEGDFQVQQNRYGCERWLEAISSRTGKSLWRYDMPEDLFALGPNQEVPRELRWFHQLYRGRMARGGNTLWLGEHSVRAPPYLEQTGSHVYLPSAPALLTLDGVANVALPAGDKLVLLDATSGELREGPIELAFRPASEIRWADVDGDRFADMVTLEEIPRSSNDPPDPKLVVWSVAKRKQLWAKPVDAHWPYRRGWSIEAPQWPVIADLDDDGKHEIIIPDGRSHRSNSFTGGNASRVIPSGNVVAYDGASGQPKWTRAVVTLDAEVDYFIDGPDIDGDGTREVFAASCDPKGENVYVDALSGASGKALWTSKHLVPGESTLDRFRIIGVDWWHSGADGWAELVVSISDNRYYSEAELNSSVLTFSAGTGTLVRVGRQIADVMPVDLDQDGAEDLIVCSNEVKVRESRGTLHCLRGIARQPWKRVAALGEATVDVDRDGVRDFVRSWGDGTLIASSGTTGREIWRSRAVRSVSELAVYAPEFSADAPTVDVNGDGFNDLIAFETHVSSRSRPPLYAISGRSGNLLWSLDEVSIQSISGTLCTKLVDMDGDGTSEVLWLAAVDYGYTRSVNAFSTGDVQLWLFVASSRTGRLRWAEPLSPAYGATTSNAFPPVQFQNVRVDLITVDMNGDGVMEVIAPAVGDGGLLETRVLEGKAGKLLWKRPRQDDGTGQQALTNWASPAVCDFEGDGKPELVLVEPYARTPNSPFDIGIAVTVVDAAGRLIWTQPTGNAFIQTNSYARRRGNVQQPIVVNAPQVHATASQPSDSATKNSVQRSARIVVVLAGNPKIVSFDSQGKFVERKLTPEPELSKIFIYDTDGDGQEELFFIDRGTLYASRADNLDEVLWQRSVGELGQQHIIELLPESESFPPLVVAQTDATSNTVMALHVRDGRPFWICPGPIARGFDSGAYLVQTNVSLLGGPAKEPPLVQFQYEFVNDCRQGFLATTVTEKAKSPSAESAGGRWVAAGTSHVPARIGTSSIDRRWLRQLPWRVGFHLDSRMVSFLLWGMFFATTLVVIPLSYVTWLFRKRRFQVRHLLLLLVVASLFVQAVVISAPEDNDFATFASRMSIALAFAVPVLALVMFVRWMVQRRWRLIGMWLTVLLIGTSTIAAISINVTLRASPMVESERFDWDGWYLILLPGAYVTSWLMVVSLPFMLLGKAAFARRRRRSNQPPRSEPRSANVEMSPLPSADIPRKNRSALGETLPGEHVAS